MGIEKFFSTVNRNFDVTKSYDLNNQIDIEQINSQYFFLDFNSIIHHTSSKLIAELNSKNHINNEYSNLTLDDIELMIIIEVNHFMIRLLERINLKNLKLVYVALDGVPSFAKILEQKKRRFMGDLVEKILDKYSLPLNWSKNNISPGTLFMKKIHKYLSNIKLVTKNILIKSEDLILDKKEYDFYAKIQKFEFSDSNTNGEGEMKIYDLINQLPTNSSVIFYSPDADVILLSMLSNHSDQIQIFKFDSNVDLLYIINIQSLKQVIYFYCEDRVPSIKIDISNLIRDIIFIFTIFGNDFVPRCESIQTNSDFLFLIDIYLINLMDNGYILDTTDINNKNFYNFLVLLQRHEKSLLFRNSYQNIYQNYNYANQKNFLTDLYKLKNIHGEIIVGKKFGEPFYNFYNNIIFYIDPYKISTLISPNKHGCLNFYLMKKEELLSIMKKAVHQFVDFGLSAIFRIDIMKNNNYELLLKTKFSSKLKKHMLKMKDLTKRESENYLINNKLDKYFHLFNPLSEFYVNILQTKQINQKYYYKIYFNGKSEKEIVTGFLKGFRWIYQYYFHRKNIDELWYYPYNKSPLFESIIKYYSTTMIEKIPPQIINIEPIEQLLYITPIRLSDLSKPKVYSLFTTNEKLMKKVKRFIESNPQFFYNLDEIYYSVLVGNLRHKLLDCSSSIFVSKCHYEILNYIVDLNQFVNKFRKTIN